ncbi:LpqB family beta-propeller domain-containing protein [Micromonospora avicenniae]|uniref:Sporulation and spore germination n=1 Tax=Micromonospora avicenniae TaxID=1198245 RepID=A0A1N7APS3_9ACTN|nr:LpqB family beta-propeller domain-containing protein [Micromonospora avicenniae]SIR41119.1 Sporulation and spore germination [Micromonospora avicenniae]
MRGRLLVGALCGALALVGFTGCGIPERTEVQIDRRKEPATEPGAVNAGRQEPPTRMMSGDDPEAFVRNFLSAAAGESDRAYYRVKQFIDPQYRNRLQEKRGSEVELTVVRLTDTRSVYDGPRVTVTIVVQQVGVLRTDGTLAPPVSGDTEYTFGLRSVGQPGTTQNGASFFVTEPPNVLLLSDTALQDYYASQVIYFWSSDRTQLVPDLRYLPDTVPNERRLNEVVKWLVGGPSDWLRTGVVGLPDRTELINNATGGDGRWEVNLDMPGDDRTQIDQLITQLAWSLRDFDGELELKIRNNSVKVENLAGRRSSRSLYPLLLEGPQRYCVFEGAIHPLADEPSAVVPIDPTANKNVVSAGLARSGEQILAALVVTTGGGKQRLTVGTGRGPVTSFAKGQDFKEIGSPVWLRSSDPRQPQGLVVADGKLYRFDQNAHTTQIVLNLPPGVVTAVAASLDGQRIALIAGGGLYVAAVNLLDGGGVTIGPSRRVSTSLTGLSALDWNDEYRLLVAASAARPAIYQISVDGVSQTRLDPDPRAKVTHLSAFPVNSTIQVSSAFMYEANGVAYRTDSDERISSAQVAGVSPPPAGVRQGNPSAPFFLF